MTTYKDKTIASIISVYYAGSDDLACKVPVYKKANASARITMSSRLADVEKAVTAKIFGRDGAKMQNKVTLSFSKDTAINNCYRVGYCISQGIVDCHVNVIQIQLTGLVKTEYKSVLLNDTVSKVWQHLGFGLGNPRFFCNDTRVYKSKTILDNMLEHRAVVEVIDGGRKRFKKNKQSPLKEYLLCQ